MAKSTSFTKSISRRRLMTEAAGAGAALAFNFPAPGILAQTRAPIRIGVLNSFTGATAYAAENNVNGMSLYLDSINWTVAGRKVELIKEDDQFNPQVGLQKAKKLVESDNVDMLVGVQASNVALAVLNYAKQKKAFYIVTGAGTDAITWDRYPYLFRTSLSTWQLSKPMADWVYANLAKEVGHLRFRLRRRPRRHRGIQGTVHAEGRQGAEGDISAARHHRFQPLSHRHQVDQVRR